MRAQRITDEIVSEVARCLRERYGFDDEDLRLLGARLAGEPSGERRPSQLLLADLNTIRERSAELGVQSDDVDVGCAVDDLPA